MESEMDYLDIQWSEREFTTISVTKEKFHAKVRDEESAWNAGCSTSYDHNRDVTWWYVAAQCVGLSKGKLGSCSDYYLVE